MKCRKILVLGSKPNAIIPDQIDFVYAANCSAHFYNKSIPLSSKLTVVVSAGRLYRNNLTKKPRFYEIVGSLRGRLVIAGVDKIRDLQKIMECDIPRVEIKSFTAKRRRDIFYSVLGGRGLLTPMLKSCLSQTVSKEFLFKYLYHLIRSKMFGTDVPGKFRPSTGLFALAYAVSEHSEESQYIVSGIGFGRRVDYPDGSKGSSESALHHIIPDMLYLAELSKKIKIYTTDQEISKRFSIPMLGDRFQRSLV